MINLFIFQENCRANAYGVGTYLNELQNSLHNTDINVNMVMAGADYYKHVSKDNISEWFIPCTHNSANEIVNFIETYRAKDTSFKSVFHFNNSHSSFLAEKLKANFDCKTAVTAHYMSRINLCKGNILKFRNTNENNNGYNEVIQRAEIEKQMLRAVDAVIAPSNFVRNFLISDYGIEPSKITRIYNGLTDAYIENIDKAEIKSTFKIPQHHKVILYTGRLTEDKGITELIAAF